MLSIALPGGRGKCEKQGSRSANWSMGSSSAEHSCHGPSLDLLLLSHFAHLLPGAFPFLQVEGPIHSISVFVFVVFVVVVVIIIIIIIVVVAVTDAVRRTRGRRERSCPLRSPS